jgi:hypothetical protein
MKNKNSNYIKLQDLEVYQLSRELSKIGWKIYEPFDWQAKKIIGDQFIEATDSVGANIAEGYGENYKAFKDITEKLLVKLNRLISATFQKTKEK